MATPRGVRAAWSVVNSHRNRSGSSTSAPTTCAGPARNYAAKNGGDLEQIKFLLGHSSIQTIGRYLGSEHDIEIAVNDNLGL
jgi:hypothetical protein